MVTSDSGRLWGGYRWLEFIVGVYIWICVVCIGLLEIKLRFRDLSGQAPLEFTKKIKIKQIFQIAKSQSTKWICETNSPRSLLELTKKTETRKWNELRWTSKIEKRGQGSGIKIFWSIELNDPLISRVCRFRMNVWISVLHSSYMIFSFDTFFLFFGSFYS